MNRFRTTRGRPEELEGEGGRVAAGRHFPVAAPCELLPYLIGLPLGLARKQAKDLLRFRAVRVSGKARVQHDTPLAPGDVVTVAIGKPSPRAAVDLHGLEIVHLDEAVIVVDKPAGLLAMGAEREKERTAHRILNEYLRMLTKTRDQQAFIVHRLDRETSGLMLLARTEAAQSVLQHNWKNVTKRYLAIVAGAFADAHSTLADRLAESKAFVVRRVEQGGELAITHYRVLRHQRDKSLLELTLETGRKHQIRVQLAARGHPILGDRKYGASRDRVPRLALHACELKFPHPVSGALLEFHSALPSQLKALMKNERTRGAPAPR